jgi:cytoskeletal protein CcmA (bactofilin family)
MRTPYARKRAHNAIDKGTAMVGNIHSDNDWIILGTLKGVLKTKGNVYIEATAEISGDIIGDSIWIAGTIVGNIYALKDLRVLPSGSITGSIHYGKLTLEEGAYLSGESKLELHSGHSESELKEGNPNTAKPSVDWDQKKAIPRLF